MTGAETSPIAQRRVDVEDYVQVLEVCWDRGRAVVGALGGDAALVDVDDGSVTAQERHEMGVLSAAWSSDGSRVAVGGQNGCVRIFDHTGAAQGPIDASAWVTALAWSSAAPVLAIGAGQDLSPVTALESDAATSRLRWTSEDSLLVGRADGGLVKLVV